MRIRAAGPADIPTITHIGHETWPPTYAFADPDYIRHGLATWWSAEAVERSLRHTSVLMAEDDDGRPLATANIDLRGDTAVIWKLYVLPQAQGTGIGAALLRELLTLAAGKPVRLAHADGNTRAAAFYAAHGFHEIRREPNDHPGWPGAVWLERPIDQIPGR